jgi:hypothetical protein
MQSLDILYYTLAAAVGLITIFLLWMLYYWIRLLQNAVYTVEKVTNVFKKADEVLEMIKEKLHSGGAYLALVANAVKSVMEYVGEKKGAKNARRNK